MSFPEPMDVDKAIIVEAMDIYKPEDYKDFKIRSYHNRIIDLEDEIYELQKKFEELQIEINHIPQNHANSTMRPRFN